MAVLQSPSALEAYRAEILAQRNPDRRIVSVCTGTGCQAYKCNDLAAELRAAVTKADLDDKVEIVATGCHGFCERGALMVIYPEEIFYQKVKPSHVEDIVTKTLAKGEVIDELLYEDPVSGERVVKSRISRFISTRSRCSCMTGGCWIRVRSTTTWLVGATAPWPRCCKIVPLRASWRPSWPAGCVVGVAAVSPLASSGRAAGRPRGRPKYVLCNADEGDPGAYMDRSLLEGNPHVVLEGMLIGAFAIGSSEGYIYVRNEYPLGGEQPGRCHRAGPGAGLVGARISSAPTSALT